jgi:hypothetical protein
MAQNGTFGTDFNNVLILYCTIIAPRMHHNHEEIKDPALLIGIAYRYNMWESKMHIYGGISDRYRHILGFFKESIGYRLLTFVEM